MSTHPGFPCWADDESKAIANALDGAPYYVGEAHPMDWVDVGFNQVAGVDQTSAAQGHPPGYAWWMRRKNPVIPTPPRPTPYYFQSPPYDRGAAAFAPQFGTLPISPIGAGIYAPYRIPTIAGPGARYEHGAIFFDVQAIPTSLRLSPVMSMESLQALLAVSHVGPAYATTG